MRSSCSEIHSRQKNLWHSGQRATASAVGVVQRHRRCASEVIAAGDPVAAEAIFGWMRARTLAGCGGGC